MRILLVTEDLPSAQPGGAAQHALMLGRGLQAAGHEVELLGRAGTGLGARVQGLDAPVHEGIVLRGTGWQEHRLRAFVPWRASHAAWRVRRAIATLGAQRFDAIHYHGHLHALGAWIPAHWPFVQTVHDQGAECMTRTRLRQGAPCTQVDPKACADCAGRAALAPPGLLRRALSAAAVRRLRQGSARSFSRHATIFVSDFLRRRFEAVAAPSPHWRATVIHNFTEVQRLQRAAQDIAARAVHQGATATRERTADPMPSMGSPPSGGHAAGASTDALPVALAVARLDEGKGVGAWLDALDERVLRRFQVRVVGDGPLRAVLRERHGPRGVEFLGHLPQPQVDRLTAAAAVCVVPSLAEEAFSLAALEALVLGRPTFALERGGVPELRRYQRYAGQLVLAHDHRGLAALLAAVADGMPLQPRSPMIGAATRHPTWAGVAAQSAFGAGADVLDRLPQILAVYRHAGLGAGATSGVHRRA